MFKKKAMKTFQTETAIYSLYKDKVIIENATKDVSVTYSNNTVLFAYIKSFMDDLTEEHMIGLHNVADTIIIHLFRIHEVGYAKKYWDMIKADVKDKQDNIKLPEDDKEIIKVMKLEHELKNTKKKKR